MIIKKNKKFNNYTCTTLSGEMQPKYNTGWFSILLRDMEHYHLQITKWYRL
jgi:hypothetical protein